MSSSDSGGGIGILGVLTVLFVGLKLTDFIDWSWWWVTAPLWGIPAIAVLGFMLWGFFGLSLVGFEAALLHFKVWKGTLK